MKARRFLLLVLALAALTAWPHAQTYTLAPVAKQQFFDGSNVAGGYKLCTYAAGTTTPATTYLDTAGTPNTNPIILSAYGRPSNGGVEVGLYLAASTYKFVLMTPGTDSTCSTGTVVWSQDNVSATPSASVNSVIDVPGTAGETFSALAVVYLSDGSGGKTPGRWYKADSANAYSSTLPEVGIAMGSLTAGQPGTIRIAGYVTGLTTLSVSAPYYVGTAGVLTSSAPANRRLLGVADTTTTLALAANPALMQALASGSPASTNFLRGDQTWSTLVAANLGTGSASSANWLRGDQTWQPLGTGTPTSSTWLRGDSTWSPLGTGSPGNTNFLRGDGAWATPWTVVTVTTTGTVNDWAPGLVGNTVIRLNNASTLTIDGFAGGFAGQHVQLYAVGGGQVDLVHEALGSGAANRLANYAVSGNTSLAAGVGFAEYVYDGTASRWRLISHEQGAWISPAYVGSDYGGNGSMTWTVDVGDVTTNAYYLRGRTLSWNLVTGNTSVGGVVNTQLRTYLGGKFNAAKDAWQTIFKNDNGTIGIGSANIPTASNIVNFQLQPAGNWTAAANTTAVTVMMTLEVQ